jgi:hypothetical protein
VWKKARQTDGPHDALAGAEVVAAIESYSQERSAFALGLLPFEFDDVQCQLPFADEVGWLPVQHWNQ